MGCIAYRSLSSSIHIHATVTVTAELHFISGVVTPATSSIFGKLLPNLDTHDIIATEQWTESWYVCIPCNDASMCLGESNVLRPVTMYCCRPRAFGRADYSAARTKDVPPPCSGELLDRLVRSVFKCQHKTSDVDVVSLTLYHRPLLKIAP